MSFNSYSSNGAGHYPLNRSKSALAASSGLSIGCGLQLGRTNDGDIIIIGLAPNGAAERSGRIFVNDVLHDIDGQHAGTSIHEAADLLRGSEGSMVTLRVSRPGGISGRQFENVQLFRSVMPTDVVAGLPTSTSSFAERSTWSVKATPSSGSFSNKQPQSENHIFQSFLPDFGFGGNNNNNTQSQTQRFASGNSSYSNNYAGSVSNQNQEEDTNIFSGFMNALRAPSSGSPTSRNSADYGRQGGVGVALASSGQGIYVASVQPGGPADRSGRIRTGDVILTVDGAPAGDSVDACGAKLSGTPGSSVLLKLKRAGPQGDEIDIVHVMREKIEIYQPSYRESTSYQSTSYERSSYQNGYDNDTSMDKYSSPSATPTNSKGGTYTNAPGAVAYDPSSYSSYTNSGYSSNNGSRTNGAPALSKSPAKQITKSPIISQKGVTASQPQPPRSANSTPAPGSIHRPGSAASNKSFAPPSYIGGTIQSVQSLQSNPYGTVVMPLSTSQFGTYTAPVLSGSVGPMMALVPSGSAGPMIAPIVPSGSVGPMIAPIVPSMPSTALAAPYVQHPGSAGPMLAPGSFAVPLAASAPPMQASVQIPMGSTPFYNTRTVQIPKAPVMGGAMVPVAPVSAPYPHAQPSPSLLQQPVMPGKPAPPTEQKKPELTRRKSFSEFLSGLSGQKKKANAVQDHVVVPAPGVLMPPQMPNVPDPRGRTPQPQSPYVSQQAMMASPQYPEYKSPQHGMPPGFTGLSQQPYQQPQFVASMPPVTYPKPAVQMPYSAPPLPYSAGPMLPMGSTGPMMAPSPYSTGPMMVPMGKTLFY